MSPAIAKAAAVRARLWCPPNAKPDLGQVYGVSIRTGERRIVLHVHAEPVQKVSPLAASPSAVPAKIAPPSYESIIKAVCRVFDVHRDVLMSQLRRTEVSQARQVAMALCRRHTTASWLKIGLIFNRDHTTVLHASRVMQPHIDAIKAHKQPGSIMEWVIALKERLRAPESVRARKARYPSGRATHCPKGHPYNDEKYGRRRCRECARARDRLRYQAMKARLG
jgi:hypothetical protein